jgi:hypothetical protein
MHTAPLVALKFICPGNFWAIKPGKSRASRDNTLCLRWLGFGPRPPSRSRTYSENPRTLENSPSLTMSIPMSTCLWTTSAIAAERVLRAASEPESAINISLRPFGRGSVPACDTRILSGLDAMAFPQTKFQDEFVRPLSQPAALLTLAQRNPSMPFTRLDGMGAA